MNSRFKFLIVTGSSALLILMLLGSIIGSSSAAEDAYRHFAVYSEVLSKIKSDYVEEPDIKNVTLGALTGLLESLDPYASYLNADQYKQYLQSKQDRKAGVGLILSRRMGYVGVVDAVPGSPAAKAGIATGDVLETINRVATRDMPLAYAELLLLGDAGSSLELSVLHVRRGAEAHKITLIRAPLRHPPVTSRIERPEIGYLQVQSLEAGKVKDVASQAADLQRQGAKKLVLDLRDNAGGSPEDGIALANLFVEKGLISYLEGQKVTRQNFEAVPDKATVKLPLVVITNRGTAGGAEIAAAALLDNKRAEVVGERTYGDAAMRKALGLDDGGAVILSIAKYYSPSGKAIQDVGVTPSVLQAEPEPPSDLEDEDAPARPAVPSAKPEEDALLKKAIEVLIEGPPKVAGR